MKITALIPAYRPTQALVDVVRGLKREGFDRIVVVDDGSGPDFAAHFEAVRAEGAELLRHAVNLGKGAALKTGINAIYVEGEADSGVVTVDADGQHLAEDAARVADSLRQAPGALVLGARAFGDAPLRSRIGNELTRFLFRLVHSITLKDTQTGLRAFGPDFARRLLTLPSQRYEFELDMLILARRLGLDFVETPIATVYLDGNRASHFDPVLDSVRIYFSLFRFSIAGLVAALIDNSVFALAFALGASVLASQCAGRAVAVVVNYLMLKRMVFHSVENDKVAGAKYLASVVVFGAVSYGLIMAGQGLLGMPVLATKIVVETAIFLANYLVQRLMVFKEGQP